MGESVCLLQRDQLSYTSSSCTTLDMRPNLSVLCDLLACYNTNALL